MTTEFQNVDLQTISITQILKSLSDPTRLKIVSMLDHADTELACSEFEKLGKKSNLSQHYRNLRQSGIVAIQRRGRHSYLSLRKDDLNQYFPGLLAAIVENQGN